MTEASKHTTALEHYTNMSKKRLSLKFRNDNKKAANFLYSNSEASKMIAQINMKTSGQYSLYRIEDIETGISDN